MEVVAAGDDDVVDSTAPVHLLDLSCRLPPSALHPAKIMLPVTQICCYIQIRLLVKNVNFNTVG